ncbi:MAG: hypothetical protein NVSMB64_01160 [Candidatus Velthaea sp.]
MRNGSLRELATLTVIPRAGRPCCKRLLDERWPQGTRANGSECRHDIESYMRAIAREGALPDPMLN